MARTIEQAVEAAVRAGDVVPTSAGEARVLAALLAAGVSDEMAMGAVETYRATIVGFEQDCLDASADTSAATELHGRICERAGRGIVEATLRALGRYEPRIATMGPGRVQPAWYQAWRLAEERLSA